MDQEAKHKSSWRPLVAAWLGWAFDGLDGYLYVGIAMPFVQQLVAREHGVAVAEMSKDLIANAQVKAALIQAVFLFGWAIGGMVFGRIGDRLGRSRTLTLTILTYAIFTGMGFFAHTWWQLMIFRFLAALGIGGEWAAGSALVAETLPKKHRHWASALLQSGYILGCIAATLSVGWITSHFDLRYVFLVGVLPAFVTLWIRHSVPEPTEWADAKAQTADPKIGDLFAPGLRSTTVLLLIHISIALTLAWAFIFFVPQMISRMDGFAELSKADQSALKTKVTVFYFSVNIFANFVATALMRMAGPRLSFAMLTLGAGASLWFGFRETPTIETIYLATGAFAFTGLGMFAIFPLYVPPLFPTLLRTFGAGLTYNFGRIVAAVGTLVAGELVVTAGGPAQAVLWLGALYIPGFFICLMLPKPK